MQVITLCDSNPYNPSLRTSPGFSCLTRAGNETILFDTGVSSDTLFHNMGKLGIAPEEIASIVLSHIDSDHVGALFGVLEKGKAMPVYLPASCPPAFKAKVSSCGGKVTEVSGPLQIARGIRSTGEMGRWIKEQSLIVEGNEGTGVLVGCGHPGILSIVRKAQEIALEQITLVVGGFHFSRAEEMLLMGERLQALGVARVAPSHCTANRLRKLLKDTYKEDFIENGVGRIIEL